MHNIVVITVLLTEIFHLFIFHISCLHYDFVLVASRYWLIDGYINFSFSTSGLQFPWSSLLLLLSLPCSSYLVIFETPLAQPIVTFIERWDPNTPKQSWATVWICKFHSLLNMYNKIIDSWVLKFYILYSRDQLLDTVHAMTNSHWPASWKNGYCSCNRSCPFLSFFSPLFLLWLQWIDWFVDINWWVTIL